MKSESRSHNSQSSSNHLNSDDEEYYKRWDSFNWVLQLLVNIKFCLFVKSYDGGTGNAVHKDANNRKKNIIFTEYIGNKNIFG